MRTGEKKIFKVKIMQKSFPMNGVGETWNCQDIDINRSNTCAFHFIPHLMNQHKTLSKHTIRNCKRIYKVYFSKIQCPVRINGIWKNSRNASACARSFVGYVSNNCCECQTDKQMSTLCRISFFLSRSQLTAWTNKWKSFQTSVSYFCSTIF